LGTDRLAIVAIETGPQADLRATPAQSRHMSTTSATSTLTP
jgi:hypothetical protein